MTSKATYLGTTAAGDPWYRGFLRIGFPPIGEGEFWFDRKGFYFSGKVDGAGVTIPTDSILEVRLGRWHARSFRLNGNILKITWNKYGRKVISGFVMDKAQQVRDALTTQGWAQVQIVTTLGAGLPREIPIGEIGGVSDYGRRWCVPPNPSYSFETTRDLRERAAVIEGKQPLLSSQNKALVLAQVESFESHLLPSCATHIKQFFIVLRRHTHKPFVEHRIA